MTQIESEGVSARYHKAMEPKTLQSLRRVFKSFNRGMVLMWRLGLGRFSGICPAVFGRLMVVEHTGRRSGAAYLTPLNYTQFGKDIYCIAAFGERTDWYRNILRGCPVAVWLPEGRWVGAMADVSGDPDRLARMRAVLIDSGFAAHAFGLHPRIMGEQELEKATQTYRLVRIRLESPAPTTRGPGDLKWVWLPVAVMAVLLWQGYRRRSANTFRESGAAVDVRSRSAR